MAAIRADLVGTIAGKPVRTIVHYTDRDPLAVEFQLFQTPQTWTKWTFSRDLLVAGMTFGAGEGDVLIRPVRAGVEITLRAPGGQASLVFDHNALFNAVQKTFDLVPLGREHIDIDKELTKAGITGWTPRKGGTR